MAAAILGPLIGSLAPFLLKKLFPGGGPQKSGSVTNYDYNQNPQIQQIQDLWKNSSYSKPWDQNQANQSFDSGVADPSTKYFQERIQPQTRNQYFSPSGVHTTAMQSALDQGAGDLATSLAGLRSNYLQNSQQTHANGQYNQIAQQLGLVNNQAGQQHDFYDPGQGIGDILGPILQKLLSGKDNILGKIPNIPDWFSGNSSPKQTQWQPQSQLSPQNYSQNDLMSGRNSTPWQVPGQLGRK
jgi:hypothetical protein